MVTIETLIRRRRRRGRSGLTPAARLGVVLLALAALLLGGAATGVARLYLEVTQIVPAVEDIEAYFDAGDPSRFRPIQVVDRRGEPLFSLSNPGATRAEWVGQDTQAPIQAPNHLVSALLTAQDPTFMQNPGYVPAAAGSALLSDMVNRGESPRPLSITEQLVAATLLPPEHYPRYSFRRDFRLLLLSERLTERYDKQQILTWYLNSAHFGNRAYGVDAAALLYFNKHADGLSLAESALLAVLPGAGPAQTWRQSELRAARDALINDMAAQGSVTRQQAREARAVPLSPNLTHAASNYSDPTLGPLTEAQLVERLGAEALDRGGLTLQLSIDAEIQTQASCALTSQLQRLAGGDTSASVPAAGSSDCPAAALLPPLRPGDSGVDHAVSSGAVVVLDPRQGTVLALAAVPRQAGAALALEPAAAGETLYPFIYLTAFSRGFSPGSMVLDLPQEVGLAESELAGYRGPVRMRTALVGGLEGATRRTLELAGLDNVLRTLAPMGLVEPEDRRPAAEDLISGEHEIDLLSLTQAYGVLAAEGRKIGQPQGQDFTPLLLQRVEDRFGRPIEDSAAQSQSVVSEGLAYMLVDVLSDEAARWSVFGQPNVFELGRPAATVVGTAPSGDGVWTIGTTPNLSIGVWFGNRDGTPAQNVRPANASGPVWNALARYVTADQPAQGWDRPATVSLVEVCSPSGLLPTADCPNVVEELYLQGTEPTTPDNLYQPVRLNRETGKLATLQTPLGLVEERVYLVPPPEALAWADAAGLEQPPSQYDPLPAQEEVDSEVAIEAPAPFAVVSGDLTLRGDAHPDEFSYYRLQYGQGLNPSRWIQIGSDEASRVWGGVLGDWNTDGLSGLYTLQLVVVAPDGGLRTASVPVTVDGQPPSVNLLLPLPGELLTPGPGRDFLVEVAAEDDVGVDRIELYLDELQVALLTEKPYIAQLDWPAAGEHSLYAVAVDAAGRRSESEAVQFTVQR